MCNLDEILQSVEENKAKKPTNQTSGKHTG